MTFTLGTIGSSVTITAEGDGCWVRTAALGAGISSREKWPNAALQARRGNTTAVEVEQLLEQGLADVKGGDVRIPYASFGEMDRLGMDFGRAWAPSSPFLLHIDRHSDLGRPDFEYRYRFLEGSRPVALHRIGCFVSFEARETIFRLDGDTYVLVEEMDAFNGLTPEERRRLGWLAFSTVKALSKTTGVELDRALASNDVVVPSVVSVQVSEGPDGSVSFTPTLPEVPGSGFAEAFQRNARVEGVYSVDTGQGRRLRVVVGAPQQEVLKRVKRSRGLVGENAKKARRDPASFFDGVLDAVEFIYGPRVAGVGDFEFTPVPRPAADGYMGALFGPISGDVALAPSVDAPSRRTTLVAHALDGSERRVNLPDSTTAAELRAQVIQALNRGDSSTVFRGVELAVTQDLLSALDGAPTGHTEPRARGAYLLIYTNEIDTRSADLDAVAKAVEAPSDGPPPFAMPHAVADPGKIKSHQVSGVHWLETCLRHPGRRGALLADDMGLGKTVQVLTFIARSIEAGLLPDLAREAPPWRPVLVVVPPMLLENETWQGDMRRFFKDEGSIFHPVLALHGGALRAHRLDARGREVEIGKPLLDLDAIRQNRVVITTYDTVKNYQHSFAVLKDGKSLWSLLVTDEAQEYKTPSSKVSHAMKALAPDFHVASTGTPVENRLLDLWNLVDTLQPALLGSAQEFSRQYEQQGDQSLAIESLRQKLLMGRAHALLLRRDKSDTIGLPPKVEHRLVGQLTARERALHQEIVSSGSPEAGGSVLKALHRLSLLYQHPSLLSDEEVRAEDWLASSSKLQSVVEALRRIRRKGEKAILFARHIRAQQMLATVLAREFGIVVRIINGETQRGTGGGGRTHRNAILNEFRETSGFALIVLSPFVAGVGLTITEANHVFHYGRWWNPAVEGQATDRVYRLGQEREVNVYLPILSDSTGAISKTFDEALDELISSKRSVAFDFLRPVDDEQATTGQLFASMGWASSWTEPDRLLAQDLDGITGEDFHALVGALVRREGAEVDRSATGMPTGVSLLARDAGGLRVVRIVEPRSIPSETDVAVAAAVRDDLASRGERVRAELWTLGQVDQLKALARELLVRLVSRDDIAARLSAQAMAHRDLWSSDSHGSSPPSQP